jgi:hypothetical protein
MQSISNLLGQFAPFVYLADFVVYRLFGFSPDTHLGEALHFLVLDLSKIFFMLIFIIWAISVIRSFFPPERARKILSSRREYIGNILAATLGIVTPFCSCSAVPMFIGFVEAGIPLGVTFSFLISAPMVNEVALIMLFGLFGWKIALLYLGTGLAIAIAGGFVIGRLKLERYVEEYVYQIKLGEMEIESPSFKQRSSDAWGYTKGILKQIWPYIVVGIGLGAIIHGWVPVGFIATVAGPNNPLAVPIAVLLGVPMYSNAAGTVPIVQALTVKGLPIGTALAFMMAVVAISLPEVLILKKVLKPRLLVTFVSIVSIGIVLIGYLFNAII